MPGEDILRGVKTGHILHPDVHQKDIRMKLFIERNGICAAGADAGHINASGLNDSCQSGAYQLVIVNYNNPHTACSPIKLLFLVPGYGDKNPKTASGVRIHVAAQALDS